MDETCKHHDGLNIRITRNERDLKDLRTIHDKIMGKINVILGGLVVACVLLVINLFVGK